MSPAEARRLAGLRAREPGYQAYSLLHLGYCALPIVAGADKFVNGLADWAGYLSPPVVALVGGRVAPFIELAGAVEVLVGLLVLLSPRWGAPLLAGWLWAIAANLLLIPGHYDVVLRDLGLSLGALALWRLSLDYQR